ncbi:TraR/DksA C4-type zinc finger protein [Pseudomonas sp. JQ170]|uniref:TraR/DksA C4-type zinc finger protein n=1 Tax=unclassified Pseudomonas TaxID=196821 RepID=UPI00264B68EA|nr:MULTISPECIES: TraR/DksA C4-type zinc finger protein [unclassified Pseudomonas]MDN7142712.1 TraR/DksA C4-type zinc finger protein [Pseudomonas sp. JQ170]WRO77936.1 TraR/DksA C4-type zinc finger protein [Pseudomonas sp. 170C]
MANLPDPLDVASEQAEYFLQMALQRHTQKPSKPSAQFCEDCDDAIPLLRQQLVSGCETCVSCQELRERRR